LLAVKSDWLASFDIWTDEPDWVAVGGREDTQHGLQLVGNLEART